MKQILFILSLFIAFVTKAAGLPDTLDVTKDLPLISTAFPGGVALKNLNCDSVHGDAGLLNAVGSYSFNYTANHPLILYFPPNSVTRWDTLLYPSSNTTLVFAPSARVVSTSLHATGTPVLQSIGASNISIIRMKYTNYQSSYVGSGVLYFTASPYPCRNIKVIECSFRNMWAEAAVKLGFVGDTDSTFWLDNVLLKDDSVFNNYNPSQPHILVGSDYHTNVDCKGFDIGNNYRFVKITGCVIKNTGGDGIFGLGLGKAFSHNPNNGIAYITDNLIEYNNFNIEINGTYCPNYLFIGGNTLSWPSYVGGYCMSVEGKPLVIQKNLCKSADNGIYEVSFYGGELSGNQSYQYRWRDSTMGYHHAAFTSGSSRTPAAYVYGFMADINHNLFSADTTGKGTGSPNEIMGIGLLGPAANGDTAYDRNSFGSLSSKAGGHKITHNTFVGQTNRLLDNSNSENQKIEFTDNTVLTSNLLTDDDLFWIKGNNYNISDNTINITGSAAPINGHGMVNKVSTSYYGEIINNNTVIGGAARVANSLKYLFKQQ